MGLSPCNPVLLAAFSALCALSAAEIADECDATAFKQMGNVHVSLRGQWATTEDKGLRMLQGAISVMGKFENLIGAVIGLAIFATFILICIFIADRILRRVIGGAVEVGIDTLAPFLLGVKVRFDTVRVDLFMGRIHIENMHVHNPDATPPYTTEYLLAADVVIIDLNMWALLKSFMYIVEVDELEFKGLKVIYERPGVFSSKSNVSDVLDFMHGAKKAGAEDAKAENTKETPAEDGTPRSFIVRKLDIQDVGAEAKIKGIAASLTIPPIQSEDLSKDCNGTGIEDIVSALAKKLAESILHHALHL